MNSSDTSTHYISNTGTQISIVGFWERCYAFSLDIESKKRPYVAVEYFAFSKDGTGEYGYKDDSGVLGSSQEFRYRVEGNRLILISQWEDDTYEFFVQDDHMLYLRDDAFNYAEEFVRKLGVVSL